MANRYFIITIGCSMNKSDSERLAGRLNELGWQATTVRRQADLAILVTCGIRQGAEDRIYGLIKQIKQDNSQTAVALTGCLSYRQDIKAKLGEQVNRAIDSDLYGELKEDFEDEAGDIEDAIEDLEDSVSDLDDDGMLTFDQKIELKAQVKKLKDGLNSIKSKLKQIKKEAIMLPFCLFFLVQ